jgi:hypothetical protein
MPSKTILLPNDSPVHFKQLFVHNNGPAIITSSFLQLSNDSPAKQHPVPNDDSVLTILQICIPTTTTSTGLQASNNRHSILNDVTSSQAFFATTAITKAPQIQFNNNKLTQTQQKTRTTSILHPVKMTVNNATSPSLFLLCVKDNSEIIAPSLFLLCVKDNSETMAPSLFLLLIKDNSEILVSSLLLRYNHDDPAIMTALNAQNLLLFFIQKDPASQASKLIVKYSKTSLYFRKDCGIFCEGERKQQR